VSAELYLKFRESARQISSDGSSYANTSIMSGI